MNLQDFEKLERQLQGLYSENTTLLKENAGYRQQIQQLEARVEELSTLANNQPIRLITQHLDPLALTNSLVRLQEKISSQAYEIAFLQQLAQDKSLLLAQAHNRASEIEVLYEQAKLQNELLNHQLKQAALRDERGRKEVDGWRARLQKSNEEHLKSIAQKEELMRKLKKQQGKNYNVLLDLAKQVTSIREATIQETSTSKDNDDYQTIEALSKMQQEELQDRNQEIARLKAINGGWTDTGEQFLKNTVKHLRGELSRYSNLIQHVTQKLALAETTIQRYSTSAEKCNQGLAQVEKLNKHILDQTKKISNLEDQLRLNGVELEKQRKLRTECKKNLVELIQENQCFHGFLFDTYGDNYEEMLKNERQKYQQRMAVRRQREKWVNVQELIDMNENLRIKLKIS